MAPLCNNCLKHTNNFYFQEFENKIVLSTIIVLNDDRNRPNLELTFNIVLCLTLFSCPKIKKGRLIVDVKMFSDIIDFICKKMCVRIYFYKLYYLLDKI